MNMRSAIPKSTRTGADTHNFLKILGHVGEINREKKTGRLELRWAVSATNSKSQTHRTHGLQKRVGSIQLISQPIGKSSIHKKKVDSIISALDAIQGKIKLGLPSTFSRREDMTSLKS